MPTATMPQRRSKNARLGFTVPQQVIYRPLVNAAWQTFCRATTNNPKDKDLKQSWYREHLEAATGKTSTVLCNRTDHFEAAMGEFEAAAGNGIRWQMRAHEGDLRRAKHGLQEHCREHDIEDSYIAGMARRMFDQPDLARLTAPQLRDILIALKLHLNRQPNGTNWTSRG